MIRYSTNQTVLVPLKSIQSRQQDNPPDEIDSGVRLQEIRTFVECFPTKVKTGGPHPHTIVETTSMNAVEPPNVTITLAIPEVWIDNGALSCVQMEAVIYACQSHEQFLPDGQRRGFLIGDGAGVGKGRTIAGIIVHNYELGRKRAIWLSVSADLRYDAIRDIEDVAGKEYCPVLQLNKFKYGKIREQKHSSKGIMFSTYASLIGKSKSGASRLKQLVEWFGPDYDGVLIFDECHRAKNLVSKAGNSGSSLIGRTVLDLQRSLPKARVVYASATGATEPRNMAYMERLGIWGPGTAFQDFGAFLNVVERRGMGAMELVAMDMKRRGLYIARQLSFHGVDFDVHEVPLTSEFKRMYDDAVAFWSELQNQFTKAFQILQEHKKKTFKSAWTHYYSACQRFFKHLCIAMKVPMCVEITKQALAQGKCVVIGLQSTGESQTNEAIDEMDGELEDFVSTPKQLLVTLIEKYFPTDLDDELGDKDPMNNLFRDIDREERKWKRKNNLPLDYEILRNEAKRRKLEEKAESDEMDEEDDDEESGTSQSSESTSGEESDDEESNSQSYSEAEGGDLVKTLMDELDSDSSSDDDDSVTEGSQKKQDDESAALSLFTMDFGTVKDPWKERQKIIDDQSRKRAAMENQKMVKSIAKKKKAKKPKEQKIRDFAKTLANEMKTEVGESTSTSSIEHDHNELFKLDFSKIPKEEIGLTLLSIKEELLEQAKKIGETLPINTLDALIDQLGGPEAVAEMTGRRGRIVRSADGSFDYKKRNTDESVSLDMINIQEKDHFMNGTKLVAIISEAASSGISLHADRRVPNTRKRVHITLELPWSADRAVQQFGRTHRSNQLQPPEYLFLISELAGEKRFVSTASKRLQSLGALTHGDRRAVAESDDLSKFSIENKYGFKALQNLYLFFIDPIKTVLCPPNNHLKNSEFYEFARSCMHRVGILKTVDGKYTIDRDNSSINKFLNRLLLMPVDVQNSIFDYFMQLFDFMIKRAKAEGTYDTGTMGLGTPTDVVTRAETKVYHGSQYGTPFEVLLHKIHVDRGMSWQDVFPIYNVHRESGQFFYKEMKNGYKSPCFVYNFKSSGGYIIIRPNTGRLSKTGNVFQTFAGHKKFPNIEEARCAWEKFYRATQSQCIHSFNHTENDHSKCEVGKRVRDYYVLSGAVLSVWNAVEAMKSDRRKPGIPQPLLFQSEQSSTQPPTKHSHIQIVRIQTNEQKKLVGVLINPNQVESLRKELLSQYNAQLVRTY
uniref:Uncharacterized protein n=1 Tax=Panagrolaimus sp. JU765 TaxID=591449 RepID=A0AC34R1C4_9BILA